MNIRIIHVSSIRYFTGKAVMKQMKLFLPCFVLFVTNLISYKVKKIFRMASFSSLLTRKDLMLVLVNDVVFLM